VCSVCVMSSHLEYTQLVRGRVGMKEGGVKWGFGEEGEEMGW